MNPDLNRSRDKKLDQVKPFMSRSNSLIQKKQDESNQLLLEPTPDRLVKTKSIGRTDTYTEARKGSIS